MLIMENNLKNFVFVKNIKFKNRKNIVNKIPSGCKLKSVKKYYPGKYWTAN